MKLNTYRNGKVYVCDRMCTTCIFRPGNLMHLQPGRVEGMVKEAGEGGAITCHNTLDGPNAVCRGFYNVHKNQILQVAERLGMVEFQLQEEGSK